MVLNVPRNASFNFSPNPLHQLPFGSLVCTVEPSRSHNQLRANTRLGIVLRNPTRHLMGWTVLRATHPFEVTQRLFLSYCPTENMQPTSLGPYLDLREDQHATEKLDNPSILARTDFSAFCQRVFGGVDIAREDGFVVFNNFGNVVQYRCCQIDDLPGLELHDSRADQETPALPAPTPAPAAAAQDPPIAAPAPPKESARCPFVHAHTPLGYGSRSTTPSASDLPPMDASSGTRMLPPSANSCATGASLISSGTSNAARSSSWTTPHPRLLPCWYCRCSRKLRTATTPTTGGREARVLMHPP